MIASFAALLVGMMFLSFSYHPVLWIYAGLAGAYYGCARTHDPDWRLRFTFLDAVVVAVLCLGLIPVFSVYLRLKL